MYYEFKANRKLFAGQLNILIEPGGQIKSNFSHSVAIDVKSWVESLQQNKSDVASFILYTDNEQLQSYRPTNTQ